MHDREFEWGEAGQRPQRARSPEEHRGISFVCPFIHLSLPGPLRPEICPLRAEIYPLRPEIRPLTPWICLLRPWICPLWPKICPLRPSRALNLPSQIQGLRGQISGLRGQILGLRGPRGMDGWMDEWTKESPLCFTGLCPLPSRCSASHSNLQPCKAGQRVSLTTYCPWATC